MNAQEILRKFIACVCALVVQPGNALTGPLVPVQDTAAAAGQADAMIAPDQLDSLVAPIALYPDPLLAQTLAASTYPLEIIQLQQWMDKNKNLKDKALADAVAKQPWDASVQALAAFPDLVKQLSDNIKWTTDLGNAFLAQQNDVMNAVQRMRAKAKDTGNLKSSDQQKVETKVIENKSVVVIQPTSPDVVYVPSYNPTVVYGAPVYPYPPIAYPPPGYYAAGMAISFGVGVAMGAAWGGCCGWNSGWGGNNNITINNNNNFVANSNRINNRQNVRAGNGNWQHNPQHRGGAPYGNRQTASRFGGTTRGDSLANRQANARQNIQRQGGRTQAGNIDRGAANRPQSGFRDGGGGRGSGGATNRTGAGGGGLGGGGGDRVGNRSVSPSSSRGSGAFGGSGGGFSGSQARASSQRGASSMGGGGGRSGGFSGGGGRGGGGGGRRR